MAGTKRLDLLTATLQDVVKALEAKTVTTEDLVVHYLGT